MTKGKTVGKYTKARVEGLEERCELLEKDVNRFIDENKELKEQVDNLKAENVVLETELGMSRTVQNSLEKNNAQLKHTIAHYLAAHRERMVQDLIHRKRYSLIDAEIEVDRKLAEDAQRRIDEDFAG